MAEGRWGGGDRLAGGSTGVCEPARSRRARGCGVGRVLWGGTGDWEMGATEVVGCGKRLEQVQRAGQGQALQKRSCREEGAGALAPGTP